MNRSLAELGIDEAALNARLASYIAWCRGLDERRKTDDEGRTTPRIRVDDERRI